jgi:hypothetical protein
MIADKKRYNRELNHGWQQALRDVAKLYADTGSAVVAVAHAKQLVGVFGYTAVYGSSEEVRAAAKRNELRMQQALGSADAVGKQLALLTNTSGAEHDNLRADLEQRALELADGKQMLVALMVLAQLGERGA